MDRYFGYLTVEDEKRPAEESIPRSIFLRQFTKLGFLGEMHAEHSSSTPRQFPANTRAPRSIRGWIVCAQVPPVATNKYVVANSMIPRGGK